MIASSVGEHHHSLIWTMMAQWKMEVLTLTNIILKTQSIITLRNFIKIKNGSVTFDQALTEKMDIIENGIYINKPLDKDGFCCIVVPRPKK